MQNLASIPTTISIQMRATIEASARRAAVTAGAMSIANPYAAELPSEFIWRVQEGMLISLERQFGRRLASRLFWDLRRMARLKCARRRSLHDYSSPEVSPRHLRVLAVMLRVNQQLQLILRLLFPLPEAMAVAAAVYRQTWELGAAWSQGPIAGATSAMDRPEN